MTDHFRLRIALSAFALSIFSACSGPELGVLGDVALSASTTGGSSSTFTASGLAGGHLDQFKSVVADSSGGTIAAGYSYDSAGRRRALLARFLSTGARDLSFNSTGFVLSDIA